MVTPAQLAAPLLGGTEGRHAGPPGKRFVSGSALISLVLLAISVLVGLSRQYTCFKDGWGYPGSAHRLCSSPVANALSGQSFPDLPGRWSGSRDTFTPGNSWLVDLTSVGGADVATAMAFLLLLNVAAVAVIGVALLVLLPRSSWVAAAFLSPVIMFSIGQGLEPVAVACAMVAVIMATRNPGSGLSRLLLSGVLLGIAGTISPIALLVPVALALWAFRAQKPALKSDVLVIIGITVIVLGVLIIADGRLLTRVSGWLANPVDRGSFPAVLVGSGVGDARLLGLLFLVLWIVATIAAAQILSMTKTPVRLETYLTVFFALALLLLPAAPTTLALWLVPAAAATVQRLWVQVAWMLAEAAFFIAVNLRDAAATQDKVGLSEGWMVIFTLVRIVAVVAVLATALWSNAPAPQPAGTADSTSADTDEPPSFAADATDTHDGSESAERAADAEAAAGEEPTAPATASPFIKAAQPAPETPAEPEASVHDAPDVIPPTFPDDPLDSTDPRH